MSPTFHGFPRLPAELRLLIWEAAMRPNRPCAHFFNILWPSQHSPPGSATPFPRLHGRERAPLVSICLHDNWSAYLLDAGLWRACQESRHVVLNAFRRHRLPHADGMFYDQRTFARVDDGKLVTAIYDEAQDLFCFRIEDCVHVACIPWRARLDALQFGFEYDADWAHFFDEELPERPYSDRSSLDGHIYQLCERICSGRIWFMDFGARFSAGRPPHDPDRVDFHAHGGKFVHVWPSDAPLLENADSLRFCQRLQRALWAWNRSMGIGGQDGVSPTIGLLCCVRTWT